MTTLTVTADALVSASAGVTATVASLRSASVAAIDPGDAAVGHAGLATALAEFCRRWQTGLTVMVDGGDRYALRLRSAASEYLGVDAGVADALGRQV